MATYRKHEAQEWAWETLKGQWTTLITPFTPDNRFDREGMKRNIRHVRSLGTVGAGCTWGMGEFWSLTHEERLDVMDAVAEEAQSSSGNAAWPIGAHVTHTFSAPEMLSLAAHAEGRGYDLLIVAPPYMVTKTEDQVVEYVRLLAEHTNLAIMFYNSPQFGITISVNGLARLCQLPNVVGVKEASFNQQISIEAHLTLGRDYVISTPDEWIYFKGQELGINQQVMFANTSDWRFDVPGANNYVRWIERACQGDFRRGVLRPAPAPPQRTLRCLVDAHGGQVQRGAAHIAGQVLGRADGHGRGQAPPAHPGANPQREDAVARRAGAAQAPRCGCSLSLRGRVRVGAFPGYRLHSPAGLRQADRPAAPRRVAHRQRQLRRRDAADGQRPERGRGAGGRAGRRRRGGREEFARGDWSAPAIPPPCGRCGASSRWRSTSA